MISRYLIYDSSCSKCSKTAEYFRDTERKGIEIVGLETALEKGLLDEASGDRPDVDFYWVEVSDHGKRIFRGGRAAWKLLFHVGPREFWRARRYITQSSRPAPSSRGLSHQRRQALKAILSGLIFMGVGVFADSASGLLTILGTARGSQPRCSKMETSPEEAEQVVGSALEDADVRLLAEHLAERGFAAKSQHRQVMRSMCDGTTQRVTVIIPYSEGEPGGDPGLIVYMREEESRNVFARVLQGSESELTSQLLRVKASEVQVAETKSASSSCDIFCLEACMANKIVSGQYGDCLQDCWDNCPPLWWCGYCDDMCWEQMMLSCCDSSHCGCPICPI